MPPKRNNGHVVKKELELPTTPVNNYPQTSVQISARIPKQLNPPQRISPNKAPVTVHKNVQSQRGRRVPSHYQLKEGDPLQADVEEYEGFWDAVQGLLDISKPNQSNSNAQK